MFRSYKLFDLIIICSSLLLVTYFISSLSAKEKSDNQKLAPVPADTVPGYPWCEGFTSSTFPPTGWTITGGTASYWLRNGSVSGFGLGVGAAYYNCWSAPANENEHFMTFTFSPTTDPSDSLEYDYSYEPYPCVPPYSQDSLIISASTNGGITWISLARYGATELLTYPCGWPTMWAIKRLNLPLGTNKIDFFGKSGFGNDIYLDSICVKHPVGIEPVSHSIPNKYYLSQNYPNPFNPSTTITFALPKAGYVELRVYDILSREVDEPVNEFKQAGTYSVIFDGSNLVSGVYFYKLLANGFAETRKMVLIK